MKIKFTKIIVISMTLLLTIACGSNKEEDVSEQVKEVDYLWFFSGKLNGTPFLYGQKTGATTVTYELAQTNTQPSTCAYSQDNGFSYNTGIYPSLDETLPTMDIEFIRLHLCSEGTQSELFNGLFSEKKYELSINDKDIDENKGKVGMYYSPNVMSSLIYKTYGGNQLGSFFEITKSTQYNSAALGRVLEGNFNVNLYNESDLSDKVEITEGRFKIVFTP